MQSNTFHFSGPADAMKFRARLYQKGVSSNDFSKFNNSTIDTEAEEIDIIDFSFQERIFNGYDDNFQSSSRKEKRLFVVVESSELPQELRQRWRPSRTATENEIEKETEETSEESRIVHKRIGRVSWEPEERTMYILAYLGQLNLEMSPRDIHLICEVRLIDKCSLCFTPSLHDSGYLLETQFGDFHAKLEVFDKNDSQFSMDSVQRPSITSLSECDGFVLPPQDVTQVTICLTFQQGFNFPYDGNSIDYKVHLPPGITLTTDNPTGSTNRTFSDKNGCLNFCHPIELTFHCESTSKRPLLMLKVTSRDFWGIQHVSGYGSCYLPMEPGRKSISIDFWRPINKNDPQHRIKEDCIGQTVDIDYFDIIQSTNQTRAIIDGESSGTVRLDFLTICQDRRFMAKEVLYQLRYGARMADMGLRSDFYQRIMKVLMEFEEAKNKILLTRAVKRDSIRLRKTKLAQ